MVPASPSSPPRVDNRYALSAADELDLAKYRHVDRHSLAECAAHFAARTKTGRLSVRRTWEIANRVRDRGDLLAFGVAPVPPKGAA